MKDSGQENLTNLLVPVEVYLKNGVYLGTRFKNKYIKPYIFRIRRDGLVIFDIRKIDEKIRTAAKLLAKYNPEDIIVVGRREYSWKPIVKFAEIIGAKAYPRRYPPGILTNPELPNFVNAKLVLVVDPLLDKNAVKDAYDTGKPVVALVDSNNTTNMVDLAIPCNNKGRKSLALIFYLLAREVLKEKGVIKDDKEFNYSIEDFVYEI
ncbi:MAG: 30S ribosomal protein S2 [Nanoarchaeota archaeon]